jgi:ribonuclease BN (tRNA processing enzyme)
MRLTVLGGSAAGPNPGMGCSSYLLRDGDTAIVIDLGPGTVPELKRHIDPRILDAIVISHAHLDHLLDLATLRYSLKYAPSPATKSVDVWIPPEARRTLDRLALAFADDGEEATFYSGVLALREYHPGRALKIGSLSISFAPGVHYVSSWSLRVESDFGHLLGYTADTGPAAKLEGHLAGTGLLIAEATLLEPSSEPNEARGHLTASEAGDLATAAHAKSLLLTHFWEELGPQKLKAKASERFHGRIELARPGLIIDL